MMALKYQRRRSSGGCAGLRYDINVTPFVDVMLVLLVIFMVAAPMMNVGVHVDLPSGQAPALPQAQPITISVDSSGKIFLKDKEVSLDSLLSELELLPDAKNERIYLRADRMLAYAQVADLISTLSSAGYAKVALVMDEKIKKK